MFAHSDHDGISQPNVEFRNYSDRSPIRQLPLELLRGIFSLCCISGLSIHHQDKASVAPALALSHTCAFWRGATLDMPNLWSKLSLRLPNLPGKEDLVDLYLLNSASAPLTLDVQILDTQDPSGNKLDPGAFSVLKSLFNTRNRWSQVSFLFSSVLSCNINNMKAVQDLLQSSTQTSLDILQSLTVLWDAEDPDVSNPFLSIFRSAPELRFLKVTGFNSKLPFSFTNLRKIIVDEPIDSLSEALWIFSNCLHLREIDIATDSEMRDVHLIGYHDSISTPQQIICSELDSLRYMFYPESGSHEFISSLTFPSLTSLDLHSCHSGGASGTDVSTASDPSHPNSDPRWPHSIFECSKNMFMRSGFRLSILKLNGRLFSSDQELIQVLTLVPTLVELRVEAELYYAGYLTDELFTRLSFDNDVDVRPPPPATGFMSNSTVTTVSKKRILPNLQNLYLSFTDHNRLHWVAPRVFPLNCSIVPFPNVNVLFEMVRSRRRPSLNSDDPIRTPRLEYFGLAVGTVTTLGRQWTRAFSEDVEPRLRELERDGLGLSLDISVIENDDDEDGEEMEDVYMELG